MAWHQTGAMLLAEPVLAYITEDYIYMAARHSSPKG